MKKMINRYIAAVLVVLSTGLTSAAAGNESQTADKWYHLEYEVNAGTNIGGAAPIPLPAEIRHISYYNPKLNLQIGATATKWLGIRKKWGVAVGLRMESKGMETKAQVKNYGMEIIQDGKKLSGRWTGCVSTKYYSQQLVVPVTAVVKLSNRFKLNFGPYVSYAFSNDFDGYVYDGYLREGSPIGDKVVFEGDSKATYDFGEELRKFQWGMQGGVSWSAYKHLVVNANLAWGCNNIFNSSFKTVSFDLYPIYLNLGFGYVF